MLSRALCLAPLALLPAACTAPQNDSNTLGGTVTLSALTADTPTGVRPASTASPDTPSLSATTFSRDHWAVARFSVPLDAPAHQPTYRSAQPDGPNDLARQRGDYPTAESALDSTSRRAAGQEIAEGFAAPLWAAFDLGLMPARALLRSPFTSTPAPDPRPDGRARVPAAWTAPRAGEGAAAATSVQAATPAGTTVAAPVGAAASVPTPAPPADARVPISAPSGYWVFRDGQWVPAEQAQPKP